MPTDRELRDYCRLADAGLSINEAAYASDATQAYVRNYATGLDLHFRDPHRRFAIPPQITTRNIRELLPYFLIWEKAGINVDQLAKAFGVPIYRIIFTLNYLKNA